MTLTIIKLVGEIIIRVLSLLRKISESKSFEVYQDRRRSKRLARERDLYNDFNDVDTLTYEMEDEMASTNNTGNVILAFLAGGVIGAALGVLFAPKSGKETRDDIAKVVEDAKAKTDEFTQEAKAKISGLVEEAKTKFSGEPEEEAEEASDVS